MGVGVITVMARLVIRNQKGSWQTLGMAKLLRRGASRAKGGRSKRTLHSALQSKDDDSSSVPRCRRCSKSTIVLLFAVISLLLVRKSFPDVLEKMHSSILSSSDGLVHYNISGILMTVNFQTVQGEGPGEETGISLGEHEARITVPKSCESGTIWLRVIGDALQLVHLSPQVSGNGSRLLSGKFSLPIEGSYVMQGFSNGCGDQSTIPKVFNVTSFDAVGKRSTNSSNPSTSEYPASAWISSKRFPQIKQQGDGQIDRPEYIWHNPAVPAASANLLKAGNTILSKEGTLGKDEFYDFSRLSNYELVCFVGSESATQIRESFLQFRHMLFPHQRPFKFHLYPINHLEKPDREWEDGKRKALRKCKHILVSIDELKDKVSQEEYITQVTTFVNHLLKVIPDETFPIWFFSVFESPVQASNCLPQSLPQQTVSDHPCNVALKHLFQNSPFPSRVKLLDTTEVSMPQLGFHSEDVAAAIALRVYVFVGKQVREWRNDGQEGKKEGLVRGGKLEPNFELIPYTEWN